MRRLNEGLELANKKHALWEIDIAIEQILGIGRFDKVQPQMWVPCDNDEGGISIELPEGVAVFALRISKIIFYVEITCAKLKNYLRGMNK
jgi:hypothetical protein